MKRVSTITTRSTGGTTPSVISAGTENMEMPAVTGVMAPVSGGSVATSTQLTSTLLIVEGGETSHGCDLSTVTLDGSSQPAAGNVGAGVTAEQISTTLPPIGSTADSMTVSTQQLFTVAAGAQSWTAPFTGTLTVELWAGGGGGGAGGSIAGGAGGGGGAYVLGTVSVTEGTVYYFEVGAGGAGSSTTTGNAAFGGDTWFGPNNTETGAYLVSPGGGGGTGKNTPGDGSSGTYNGGIGAAGAAAGVGGGGGGGAGSAGNGGSASGATGGAGGTPNGGQGGPGGASGAAGSNGYAPSGGGGGGGFSLTAQPAGASGAAGQVRLSWSNIT